MIRQYLFVIYSQLDNSCTTPEFLTGILNRDSQTEALPRKSKPGFSTGNISPGFLTGILNRKPLPGNRTRDSQPEGT